MEAVAAQSVLYAKTSRPLSSCSTSTHVSPSFLQCKTSPLAYQSAQNLGFRRLNLQCIRIKHCRKRNNGVVHASSDGATASVGIAQGWLLEPVGDGDWRHIGSKVPMPGAYEIFSSEMIVGRVPDKADLVIPVATVSGLHARIQNKGGNLLVTDLDSTNGTYINEKRVAPGSTAVAPPGSLLTFGDTHLAIFRVSKLEKILEIEAADSEENAVSDGAEAAPEQQTTG